MSDDSKIKQLQIVRDRAVKRRDLTTPSGWPNCRNPSVISAGSMAAQIGATVELPRLATQASGLPPKPRFEKVQGNLAKAKPKAAS